MLKWTISETLFFIFFATMFTFLYKVVNIKWLQVPLVPVSLIGTAVAFMVGFQNNAAYYRICEALKIWGGIVNGSRTLIINIRGSFYLHRAEEKIEAKQILKVIANRHIAWLTALRNAMRAKKQWETNYNSNHKKTVCQYNIPEFKSELVDELRPFLSEIELNKLMQKDNKPNAIISL